jgi:hypothetical protein
MALAAGRVLSESPERSYQFVKQYYVKSSATVLLNMQDSKNSSYFLGNAWSLSETDSPPETRTLPHTTARARGACVCEHEGVRVRVCVPADFSSAREIDGDGLTDDALCDTAGSSPSRRERHPITHRWNGRSFDSYAPYTATQYQNCTNCSSRKSHLSCNWIEQRRWPGTPCFGSGSSLH